MGTEERATKGAEVEAVYKTKVVQFFDRSVPIILQNDNGPCPLIAISNVLLLRNNMSLGLDTCEVPLQKLLSLVAERLIDSNSNVENKDVGYVQNQQKNIADALEHLPHLATGIDVNLHFHEIAGFEFTPERSIFDLLGIELYHGWIVDPQDMDTLNAIGSKSYNALIGELVSLETRNEEEDKCVLEEDSVDFAAATTATLGVPSPCLSRGRSFDDPPVSVPSDQKLRKGDMEEQEDLMRVLQLSKADVPPSTQSDDLSDLNQSYLPTSSEESVHQQFSNSGDIADSSESPTQTECERLHQLDLTASQDMSACSNYGSSGLPSFISTEPTVSLSKTTTGSHLEQSKINESADCFVSGNNTENTRDDVLIQNQTETFLFPNQDSSLASTFKDKMSGVEGDQIMLHTGPDESPQSFDHLKPTDHIDYESKVSSAHSTPNDHIDYESKVSSAHSTPNADSDSLEGILRTDVSEGIASSMDGSEPIYEGEERILDVGHSTYENGEPMYEGEMELAEQADGGSRVDNYGLYSKDEVAQEKRKGPLSINAEQGELIRNFLKNNASQLTVYGLFCLQEGLKERELCVFFRNNHFSTMFKFNGDLYLLATDQGYINQSDLVWEKLNEVNGDSVFMTGNFREFKAENQANDSWDEQNAMTSTADYIASIDNSTMEGSTLNSDLQLAIALQQQEFENQSPRQTPQNTQQSHLSSQSRLVTGPQGPRNSSNSSTKHDATKTKDKCSVM